MNPDRRFWSGKRVCVTGGTGFLGYHLVSQLLELGAAVRVLALPPPDSHPIWGEPRVERCFGDLRGPVLVRKAVAGCQVIFHTAAVVAAWGPLLKHMVEVNVLGTCNVLAAAPREACVVHTSSIVTVGASLTGAAVTEESIFNLGHVRVDYVHTKRAAEEAALRAADQGQRVVITNPGYLVGPEDHERSVMGRVCVRYWKGRIPFVLPGGLNLVDIRDVARGHLLAAEHGRSGQRYILGGENRTMREFLIMLAETAGFRPRVTLSLPLWAHAFLAGASELRGWLTSREPCTSFQHLRMSRWFWFCRSDRAVNELGYRARPLADTLADTYRWHTQQDKVRLRSLNRWWMRPEHPLQRAA